MKSIALHIMDISQNSIAAGAGLIEITVREDFTRDLYVFSVCDNGRGMDPAAVDRVTDPFFTTRTTRRVGMGIPLLKHSAEQSGGSLSVSSRPGYGTRVEATFIHSSIDRPPEGDIPGVVSLLAGANPERDFLYKYSAGDIRYTFDTREIKKVLEEVPLSEPAVIRYMKEMIEENTVELQKSK
jgi:hypothetical protein